MSSRASPNWTTDLARATLTCRIAATLGPVQDEALLGWRAALTARYRPAGARWSFHGQVRNFTNYAVRMSAFPATTIGDPRQFSLSAMLNW